MVLVRMSPYALAMPNVCTPVLAALQKIIVHSFGWHGKIKTFWHARCHGAALTEKMWHMMAFGGNWKCMLTDCSCFGSTYFRDPKRVTRSIKHGQRCFAETFRGDLGDGPDGVCP